MLPIRTIDFSNFVDRTMHDQIVSLVDHIMLLHERSAAANTNHEQTIHQHQIDATDRQIDRLVYELYGLTEEEVELVEARTPAIT